MSGVLCAAAGILAGGSGEGGGGGTLDTETLTVGHYLVWDGPFYNERYGFNDSLGFGSISDGLFAPKGNAAIAWLEWWTNTGEDGTVSLALAGTHTNSGWSSMAIGAQTFARSAASFSGGGGGTVWSWASTINPFSGGGIKSVVFT